MQIWAGEFGKEYTDRNWMSPTAMSILYRQRYGVSRMQMNIMFLGELNRRIRILEVGSNIGNQLVLLKRMGFCNLVGLELQEHAIKQAHIKGIIQASAFNLPFKDESFDFVFTSGLLIHIAPESLDKVMDEMFRCTKRYIWGMEYFAQECMEINYRGHDAVLWKANFPKLFIDRFRSLMSIKCKYYKYTDSDNVDVMYLMEKVNE